MISLNDTFIFKKLLGENIRSFRSTALDVSEYSIKSIEINMCIGFKKSHILLMSDYKIGFFEDEDGNVFYDYTIESGSIVPTTIRSSVTFNTSEITKIEIFGRDFDAEKFKNYPKLYNKIKNEKKTDDIFLFNCKNNERILVVFHPFMACIDVLYKQDQVDRFWNQYGSLYKLYHTINGN